MAALCIEDYLERYCYSIDGEFEWKMAGTAFDYLYDQEQFTWSELVADPVGSYKKMQQLARSRKEEYSYHLMHALSDLDTRAAFLSNIRKEDREWILESAYDEELADVIENIIQIGIITAEEVAQRKKEVEANREEVWKKFIETCDDEDIPF
jgi:predicted house-cleaning noncanonical NTP pyrophosphatase (MazG superfamily)